MPPNPPQNNDDIIELTDIVEQGTVALSDDDADFLGQPGDDSFEKELEDLFADQPEEGEDDTLLLEDEVAPPAAEEEDLELESAFSDLDSPSEEDSQDELNTSLNKSFGLLEDSDDDLLGQETQSAETGEDSLDFPDFDDLDKELGLLDEPEQQEAETVSDLEDSLLDDTSAPAPSGLNKTDGIDDLDDLESLLADVDEEEALESIKDIDADSLMDFPDETPEELSQELDNLGLELDQLERSPISLEDPEPLEPLEDLLEEEEIEEIEEVLEEPGLLEEPKEPEKEPEPVSELLETETAEDIGVEAPAGAIDELDQLMDELDISLSEQTDEDEEIVPLEEIISEEEDNLDSLLGDLEIQGETIEEDAGFDALERLADQAEDLVEYNEVDEEFPDLLEPWNEVNDEDLLNDLARESQASASDNEEAFPDLDELIASLGDSPDQGQDTLSTDSLKLEPLEEAFPDVDALSRLEAMEARLDKLEQSATAEETETLSEKISTAIEETLGDQSPLLDRLVQLAVERMEPQLAEIVDKYLETSLPSGDMVTKAQMQELSDNLRSELTEEMNHLAAKAAAGVIREELSALLTEEGEET